MTAPGQRSLVLFDGLCNLCDATVNFIIDRDPEGHFAFAPLQSPTGQALVTRSGLSGIDVNSVILVEGDRYDVRSTAALRIARQLSGFWPLLYAFIVVPRPLRDLVYRWIAQNRYRWFGMRDECRVPTPQLAQRFVDGDGVARTFQAEAPAESGRPDVVESKRPRALLVIASLLLLMAGFAVATFVPDLRTAFRRRASSRARGRSHRRTGSSSRPSSSTSSSSRSARCTCDSG
jgi:predicted DCC family thiol-disulfide oxidoreductase YuxK